MTNISSNLASVPARKSDVILYDVAAKVFQFDVLLVVNMYQHRAERHYIQLLYTPPFKKKKKCLPTNEILSDDTNNIATSTMTFILKIAILDFVASVGHQCVTNTSCLFKYFFLKEILNRNAVLALQFILLSYKLN